ncbi:MAG: FecR domain-containing protein [Tannerella sp.]|nr:FecR domain-containing protein [Tannerella sp.]
MDRKTNREDETQIDAYYREQWEQASEKEMPRETEERILRAIAKRMRGDAFRFVPAQWVRYAAAMLAGVILVSAIRLFVDRTPAAPEPAAGDFTVFADKGQRSNVTLPDGTKVWLNSHSKITYPRDYGIRERALALTGEAYFEVAKDSSKRFTVNAGEMQIEALGTSFNVKAYGEDCEIVTTLFSGSVQTTVRNKTVALKPEQYATFNRENSRLTVRRAENVAYAAMWRDNELAFNRQTMDEIAVMFDRLYNVNIQFESEKIRKYRFSGVIKNNSLDNVIEIISLTAPIVYRYRADTIILSEKKHRVKNKIVEPSKN